MLVSFASGRKWDFHVGNWDFHVGNVGIFFPLDPKLPLGESHPNWDFHLVHRGIVML